MVSPNKSIIELGLEKELKNKCRYLPEAEWESCHILKNK